MVPGPLSDVLCFFLLWCGDSDRSHALESIMKTLRFAIRISVADDATLRQLYIQFGIPDGQYKKRPDDLIAFTATWNFLTGRSDSSDDLLHYIETQRKQKRKNWPTFDGAHRIAPSVSGLLTKQQDMELRRIYAEKIVPLDVGTDTIFHDPKFVRLLADEFAKATGVVIPGTLLMAYIEAKRKRRDWLALKRDRTGHIGFDDIDELKA